MINTNYSCYIINTQWLLVAVWWVQYIISVGYSNIITAKANLQILRLELISN